MRSAAAMQEKKIIKNLHFYLSSDFLSVTGVNQSIQTQLSSEDNAALLPRQTLFPKRIRAVELLKSVLHASSAALSDSMSF